MTGTEFNAADIEGLLTELETRLVERGVAAVVYIVGGAAIALREVTPDRPRRRPPNLAWLDSSRPRSTSLR